MTSSRNNMDEEMPLSGSPISSIEDFKLQLMRAKKLVIRMCNLGESYNLIDICKNYFENIEQFKEHMDETFGKSYDLFNDFSLTVIKTDAINEKINVLKGNLELNNNIYNEIASVISSIDKKTEEIEKSIKNNEIEKSQLKNTHLQKTKELIEDIHHHKNEIQLMETKCHEVEDATNMVNQQYLELSKNFDDFNKKYSELQLENHQTKMDNNLLTEELTKMSELNIQEINDNAVANQKKIDELLNGFELKSKIIEDMEVKAKDMTTYLNQLQEQKVTNDNQLTLLQSQIEEINVECNELNEQLEEIKCNEYNTVNCHLETIKTLKGTVTELTEKSNTEQTIINDNEQKYSLLMNELRADELKINQLREENRKMTDELRKFNAQMIGPNKKNQLRRHKLLKENKEKRLKQGQIKSRMVQGERPSNFHRLSRTFQPPRSQRQSDISMDIDAVTLDFSDFSDGEANLTSRSINTIGSQSGVRLAQSQHISRIYRSQLSRDDDGIVSTTTKNT